MFYIRLLSYSIALSLALTGSSIAAPQTTILSEKTDITLHADQTTTTLSSIKQTLHTAAAAKGGQQTSLNYFPGSEQISVVKAYVQTAQGSIKPVLHNNIFIHPAPAAKDAPGFTKQLVKTVVFPQLVPGDTTFIEWKIVTKHPSPFGFQFFIEPNFSLPTNYLNATIHYPKAMPIAMRGSPLFHVTTTQTHNTKTISITLTQQPGHTKEPFMVSASDLLPYFELSSIPTWEKFGNIWNHFYQQQLIITPQVKAQALAIANGTTGLEAVRRFYNWISNYINYIDVTSDVKSNYIPHTPQEILNNGYGDCKDYAMLMVAFSKVIGVRVEPAMINWGLKYRPYPLPTASAIDHAIVYLPDYKLFLNPTNIYATFGTLDVWLRDKQALVLSDHSKLIATPKGDAQSELFELQDTNKIDANGNVAIQFSNALSGSLSSVFRARAFASGPRGLLEKLAQLTTNIVFIKKVNMNNLQTLQQPVLLTGDVIIPSYLSLSKTNYFSGRLGISAPEKLFLTPYIFQQKRLYPLIIGAKTLVWKIRTLLPPHYHITHLPDNLKLSNQAGSYAIHYSNHRTYFDIDAKLVIDHDIYQANQYPALRNLLFQPINLPRHIVAIKKS